MKLYYTDTDGTTEERDVAPCGVEMFKHPDLPEAEWFFVAYDLETKTCCMLRLAGCDFTQGSVR